MTFEDILAQAVAILQRRQRVTYRALKAQFELDDDLLETLKDELLFSYSAVTDDEGRGLVWTGEVLPQVQACQPETDSETRFQALLLAVIPMLKCERRVTYRTLKYVFSLDESLLNDIRKELSLRRLAMDEDGEVLV